MKKLTLVFFAILLIAVFAGCDNQSGGVLGERSEGVTETSTSIDTSIESIEESTVSEPEAFTIDRFEWVMRKNNLSIVTEEVSVPDSGLTQFGNALSILAKSESEDVVFGLLQFENEDKALSYFSTTRVQLMANFVGDMKNENNFFSNEKDGTYVGVTYIGNCVIVFDSRNNTKETTNAILTELGLK